MINEKISGKRRNYEILMRVLMALAVGLTAGLVIFLVFYVLSKGLPNISWDFVTTAPSYLTRHIGILPDILNTLYIVFATLLIVIPLGVCGAVYLTEYAENKKLVAVIEYTALWVCLYFQIIWAPAFGQAA